MVFDVIQSEMAFHGRAFSVRQDLVALQDGKQHLIDVIEHVGAVTLLPIDADGQIWFIRQYRHPVRQFILELPAGTMEPNELPEATASREIREEIGMGARKLTMAGEFFMTPGYSSERMYFFVAEDLYPAPLNPDEGEFISVEKMPVQQAYHMALSGELQDGKSLAALLLARPFLAAYLDQ